MCEHYNIGENIGVGLNFVTCEQSFTAYGTFFSVKGFFLSQELYQSTVETVLSAARMVSEETAHLFMAFGHFSVPPEWYQSKPGTREAGGLVNSAVRLLTFRKSIDLENLAFAAA